MKFDKHFCKSNTLTFRLDIEFQLFFLCFIVSHHHDTLVDACIRAIQFGNGELDSVVALSFLQYLTILHVFSNRQPLHGVRSLLEQAAVCNAQSGEGFPFHALNSVSSDDAI